MCRVAREIAQLTGIFGQVVELVDAEAVEDILVPIADRNALGVEQFAAVVGVCGQTIYNWLKDYPAFLEAKNMAFEKSRKFWEEIGINLAKKGEGNATAFIFNMKNRFPRDWRDRQEVETTHKGVDPIAEELRKMREGDDAI